ncbi:MAG: disulfide isomerase DsbC N-terminal domain-containing protein [Arcobacteraceae bacterium]
MIRKSLVIAAVTTSLFSNTIIEQKQFDLIQSIIPSTKIEKVKPSLVSGMYEAYFEDGSLMYILPSQRLIFMGEIYTHTGEPITQNSINLYKQAHNIKSPLEQNLKKLKEKTKENQEYLKKLISNGIKSGDKQTYKHNIVVLKSLNCSFCKQLDQYLETKQNIVTYVYLAPEKESEKFYKEHFNIINPIEKIQAQSSIIGEKLHGFGVPFALIIDENNNLVDTIEGFNKAQWDKYLGETK